MDLITILVILAIALLGYAIVVYNALQTLRTRIVASIQEIGNQLKRQADLIPNLLESTKGYMKHEKDIFGMLSDARTKTATAVQSASAKNIDQAQASLEAVLPKIQVLVESNPQLKADSTVNSFMNELRDTADKLMYSRRVLIDLTQDFNQKLVTFPSNVIANIFGFKEEKGLVVPMEGKHLEVSDGEAKSPTVKF